MARRLAALAPPPFITHGIAGPAETESGVTVIRCKCHLAFVSDRVEVATARLDQHVAHMRAMLP